MNRWDRRIGRKLKAVASGFGLLSHDPAHLHDSIHRARRLNKQLRALLALLPNACQRPIRKIVRDQKRIVRQLGLFRDETLFQQNIKALGESLTCSDKLAAKSNCADASEVSASEIATALNQLSANVTRIHHRLQANGHSITRRSVAKHYRRSFRTFLKLTRELSSASNLERWHDLRKGGKVLEYQTKFLRKYSHQALDPIAGVIIDLGKHLGQLNDLAKAKECLILRQTLLGNPILIAEEAIEDILQEIELGCDKAKRDSGDLLDKLVPAIESICRKKLREIIE